LSDKVGRKGKQARLVSVSDTKADTAGRVASNTRYLVVVVEPVETTYGLLPKAGVLLDFFPTADVSML